MGYCAEAIALGLSKFDGLPPGSPGTGHSAGEPDHPSSSHPPATSANHSSSSSSHNQQHHHNNMSTLKSSEAGDTGAQLASDIAFTRRSNEGMYAENAGTVLDASSSGNLNIEFPMYSRATLSMEIIRDENHIPSTVTRHLSGSDVETTHGLPEEPQSTNTDSHTIGNPGQDSHSPRKALPSHWLPKSSGPTLATAQRAKERSHKKDSQSGSPIQARTTRGARSSIDSSKSHGVESSTYLTKEALAAVEKDIVSPTTALGSDKLHRSPSKPTWRSPTTSPLRSSASQHLTINTKMSPTRASLLNVSTASGGHSRAPSSVSVSCGTFHTANESPVSSLSGTELSFKSAPEHPEDAEIPRLKLDTDDEMLQANRHHDNTSPVKQKAATVGKTDHTKPRLALQIPVAASVGDTDSECSPLATAGSSSTNARSSSPEVPRLVSRIPRVVGTVKSGSAYNATRSSTLKRTQSLRSLATKLGVEQSPSEEPHHVPLPNTPAALSIRHVRTVNSSGTTPVLSRHLVQDSASPSYNLAGVPGTYSLSGGTIAEQLTQRESDPKSINSALLYDSSGLPHGSNTEQNSPSASTATVKASPLARDPVPTDSSIIYSRKKDGNLRISIGNLNRRNTTETFEFAAPTITASAATSAPDRTARSGSELRATAADFVPQHVFDAPVQSASNEPPESVPSDSLAPPQFQPAPWFPLDLSGFDKHGIPWFYYMYPVQFAYDQGFRNGRSKAPRKPKPRKQRQSGSPPADAQHSTPGSSSLESKAILTGPSSTNMGQSLASVESMPPPPVPAHTYQQGSNGNRLKRGTDRLAHYPESSRGNKTHETDAAFSRQLDVIAQQGVLCNSTNVDLSRGPIIDLTAVRNVNNRQESYNTPYTKYHTVSMRHGRYHHRHAGNGLYNGRGSSGVPMSATTPFPDPSPPQGRPPMGAGGSPAIIGTEACGVVDIVFAAELGGGWPCNTCAPDH